MVVREVTSRSNTKMMRTSVVAAAVRVEAKMAVLVGDQVAVAHLGTIAELVYRFAIEYYN